METLGIAIAILLTAFVFYRFDFRHKPIDLLLFEPVNIGIGGVLALVGLLLSKNNILSQIGLSVGSVWLGMAYGMELKAEILKGMGGQNRIKGILEGIAVIIAVFLIFKLLRFSFTCALFLAAAAAVSHPLAARIFRDERNLMCAIDWTPGIVLIWSFEMLKDPVNGLLSPTIGLLTSFAFFRFCQSFRSIGIRLISGFTYGLLLGLLAFGLRFSPLMIGISAGIVFENMLQSPEDKQIERLLDYATPGIYVMFLLIAGNLVGNLGIENPFFLLLYFLVRGVVKISAVNGRFVLIPQGGLTIAIANEAILMGCDSIFGMVVLGLVLNQLTGFMVSSAAFQES